MIQPDSLVLYRQRPARVVRMGDKLQIELPDGQHLRVRRKDVTPLHPGPLHRLEDLRPLEGELVSTWEILQEAGPQDLAMLAELMYGEFVPATAWAAWQLVEDGLYFSGNTGAVFARSPEQVDQTRRQRAEQAAAAQAWESFLERARAGRFIPGEDDDFLTEVVDLAYERRSDSRVLRELGRGERREVAHAFLLEIGYWDHYLNPYPIRQGVSLLAPAFEVPGLPDEPRRDLTYLPSYAIDNRDNRDPDDALSLEDGRLWVHVADVAALLPPGSPADQEARSRGATLYLPEGMVPMLPLQAIERLGLGLQPVTPALSFGLRLNAAGELDDIEITPSWVQVERTTYEEVENHLLEEPFRTLLRLTLAYRARRQDNGGLFIDLPEVDVLVEAGLVEIRPVLPLQSRAMVQEAMLMAGEAAARFAVQRALPFPFSTQEAPDLPDSENGRAPDLEPEDMAARFAMRRLLSRSQVRTGPFPHAGIGLPVYSRVTSPLRRYLDLVAHQQLRASLTGQEWLSEQMIIERVGATEAITGAISRAENLSRRHWTLVYLEQHPDWKGEAVLVENRGSLSRLLIPALGFETDLYLQRDLPLNSRIQLAVRAIDLAALEAHFEVFSA